MPFSIAPSFLSPGEGPFLLFWILRLLQDVSSYLKIWRKWDDEHFFLSHFLFFLRLYQVPGWFSQRLNCLFCFLFFSWLFCKSYFYILIINPLPYVYLVKILPCSVDFIVSWLIVFNLCGSFLILRYPICKLLTLIVGQIVSYSYTNILLMYFSSSFSVLGFKCRSFIQLELCVYARW